MGQTPNPKPLTPAHPPLQIKAVSKTAGTATASVGKFDKQARGDKADARTSGKRKQRSSLFDPSEGKKTNSLVDKIIRERRYVSAAHDDLPPPRQAAELISLGRFFPPS